MNIRQFALPLIITIVLLVVGIATLQRMGVEEPADTASGWPSDAATAAQSGQAPSGGNQQAGALDEMVVKLEKRLKEQEGTADDWLLLGKTYQYLGRKEEAEMAYTRAKELGFDPDKLKQAKNDMSQQLNASAPRLAKPDGKMNSLEVAALNQTLAHTPDAKNADPAIINGTLSLSPDLQAQLPSGATLFIFARSIEPGQGAPFAVLKTQDLSFPQSFQLTDSHAVIPGRTLSGVKDVIIGARITMTGNASGTTGDLEGQSQPVSVSGGQPVELQINQIRQ